MDEMGVVIQAGAAVLRPHRAEDADDVVLACNDPLTQRFLTGLPSPYRREDALEFLTGKAPAMVADGRPQYAIADPATGRLLGAIGFGRAHGRVGEVGYWVAPWARRRGVATAAVRALSDRAFANGFGRLELRTDPANTNSQRVALAAGFSWECVQRQGAADEPEPERRDRIMWVRLPEDPPGPTRRILPDLPGGQLTDGTVTLRPVGADDVDDMLALRSLPEVVRSTVPPKPPERADVARRCIRAMSHWLSGHRAVLSIRDAASGRFAGEIGLLLLERNTDVAMTGYGIAPQWRGLGYASAALRLLADWAFDAVGLVRIEAGTSPDNAASQRVLEAAGFRHEGRVRGSRPGPDGTRSDDLMYGLLKGELIPTRTPRR